MAVEWAGDMVNVALRLANARNLVLYPLR